MYKVKLDGYVLYHADHPSAMLTDPVLELEPGYAGVFTATVPPDNPLYDRIDCRKSMLGLLKKSLSKVASVFRHWLQKTKKKRLQPVEVAAVL